MQTINYYLIINISTFIIYGIDKYLAIKNLYRISEKILLLLSILGGSIGALISMYLFHHKTKKARFIIVNLTSLIIHIPLII